tara:strand:+ start:627 stop:3278 length:2652 start_codon:yes stop_codon:yes gene_type:complete
MTTYYVDLKDGNDSNDGTTFANRKKTIFACQSLSYDGNNDEIRVKTTGGPTLLDNNAKIWNTLADGARDARYISSVSFSSTEGETSITISSHGCQTGETIAIYGGSASNQNLDGTYEVTRVDANNVKLQGYTCNSGLDGQTSSGGYWRKLRSKTILLSSAKTKNIASTGSRTTAWTASTNVTCTLATNYAQWGSSHNWMEHAYSDKIAIGGDFTTGKAAYFATGSLNLSGYQQVSLYFQQQSGTKVDGGNYSIKLCTDTQGDTPAHTMALDNYGGTTKGFRPQTKDFGSNLNSAIQSIALYVDTDQGAQDIYLNNIIACKDSSDADSLTLNSIVGLKDSATCPHWYAIESINDKRILLNTRRINDGYFIYSYYAWAGVDWDQKQCRGGTPPGAIAGIARTTTAQTGVSMYKIEPLSIKDMGLSLQTGSSSQIDATKLTSWAGTSSARHKISGGWNATDMSTQDAWPVTCVDFINMYGYAWYFSNCNYTDFSDFIGVRGYYSMMFSSCSYSSFDHVGGTCSNQTSLYMSSCSNQTGNWYVWGNQSQYAVQISSTNQYVSGISSIFGTSGNYAVNLSSNNNNARFTKIFASNAGQGMNGYFTSNQGMTIDEYWSYDQAYGNGTYGAAYWSNCNGAYIGVCTNVNTEDGFGNFESTGTVQYNVGFSTSDDTSTTSGGIQGGSNYYYGVYTGSNGYLEILNGGEMHKRPYLYSGGFKTNKLVYLDSQSPSISNNATWLSKNHDNVTGDHKNYYQYGNVAPNTSIRHTASGISWKIDIDSSSASSGSPIEWELAKVIVNSGSLVTMKIWVYRDGTGVNGGIRVKSGAIGGVTSNVDAVISDTTINSWVECSLTFTPTEAGAVTVYAMGYYINSTSHYVYLDDFSATQA